MALADWVKEAGRGAIAQLARDTGLSRQTIVTVMAGHRTRYAYAKKISAATNGAITVEELCEGQPWPKKGEQLAKKKGAA